LSFEFDFIEAPGNDDSFNATISDYATGTILRGPQFWETSVSGIWIWNVPDIAGTLIGLEFQLFSDDDLYDSTLTVSNIDITPVPLPTTLLLLGSGIAGLVGLRRKDFR
jgi:hypothetical protein